MLLPCLVQAGSKAADAELKNILESVNVFKLIQMQECSHGSRTEAKDLLLILCITFKLCVTFILLAEVSVSVCQYSLVRI